MQSMFARTSAVAVLVAVAVLIAAVGGAGYASGGKPAGSASGVEKLTTLSKKTPSDTTASKRVTARCPKGLKVLGGGAHILAPASPGRSLGIALELSGPSPEGAKRPTGWIAGAGAGPMAANTSWSLEATVICGR
jgi:hypothetical protein